MTDNVKQNVRRSPFNPATKALQFRAWQIAQREGGNITRAELADELGVSSQRLLNVIRDERWADSLPRVVADRLHAKTAPYSGTVATEILASAGVRLPMIHMEA